MGPFEGPGTRIWVIWRVWDPDLRSGDLESGVWRPGFGGLDPQFGVLGTYLGPVWDLFWTQTMGRQGGLCP